LFGLRLNLTRYRPTQPQCRWGLPGATIAVAVFTTTETTAATTITTAAATTITTATAATIATATATVAAATTTVATTATETAATGARTILTRPRHIYRQRPLLKITFVEQADGFLGFLVGFHFYESKTSGTPGVSITHHCHRLDRACLLKQLPQVFIRRVVRQVTNIQLIFHFFRFSSLKIVSLWPVPSMTLLKQTAPPLAFPNTLPNTPHITTKKANV
jgi:hypothetical protein